MEAGNERQKNMELGRLRMTGDGGSHQDVETERALFTIQKALFQLQLDLAND